MDKALAVTHLKVFKTLNARWKCVVIKSLTTCVLCRASSSVSSGPNCSKKQSLGLLGLAPVVNT